MIRLGIRLAFAGGKEAITRLALIATAVAIGVGLLLTTIATMNAFSAQNERYAWLETGYPGAEPAAGATSSAAPGDPLWWQLRLDYFQGEQIGRVDVAATGPDSPVPPGIPALPAPGEFYASPALSALLSATPAPQLGARFPGTQVGTIGPEALPAPDTLLIVVGRDAAALSRLDGATQVTSISTTPPSECSGDCAPGVGTDSDGMTLVLSVVAAALLFPVLIFIGGATRLSAARREQRFAAMRLIGATPRQITTVATVESSVATIAGTVVGIGLFVALRPAIAAIPFSGERFFTSDVSLSPANVALVALGIPVAAAVAARLALRRVTISPLGVTRRVTPHPPRPRRVVPLLGGIAWLGYLAFASDIGASQNSTGQAIAYLAGVFLIMIGLIVAGPWLTMLASRITARRMGRPAGLIAARRLADDPQRAFRAISGVVLAVFVGSCAIGIISTIVAYNAGAAGDPANATGTLVHRVTADGPGTTPDTAVSPAVDGRLTSIPGVTAVTAIHVRLTPNPNDPARPEATFLVSCVEIAATPALGHCPAGADTAAILPHFGGGVIDTSTPMSDTTWPAGDVSADELADLPLDAIVVDTDGSTPAVEEARTLLAADYPTSFPPQTLSELEARNSRTIDRYQRLANVVLFTSLPIAGCSLAVSVAGGLADRRRPFSLLRLTGVPLAMLRRVVTLEAAIPLLVGVVVSAVAGLTAAALFLRAQLDQTLQPLGVSYYIVVAAGVLASLAIIASTLPLLARTTGPDVARND